MAASQPLNPAPTPFRNECAPTHRHATQSDADDEYGGYDIADGRIPSNDDLTHDRRNSVDTIDVAKQRVETAAQVFWKGNPFYVLTWELLGIAISICFLVLGALVVSLKDRPESYWSMRIVQATRIAPSLWPILFSGILGNAVRHFANWRVERGVPLLALEQLMGSLTMAGSIISMFTWSMFQVSSVVLILLWAFNPLGSQASFRGVYLANSVGSDIGNITYYNHNLTYQKSLSMWFTGYNRFQAPVRALYSAALYDVVSSTQYVDPTSTAFQEAVMKLGGNQSAGIQAATDTWGNIRIPHMEYHPAYDPANPNQWLHTPWTEGVQNYSSLIGDRIEGINRSFTGTTNFTITSSYQSFNCSPWSHLTESEAEGWANKTLDSNFTSIIWPASKPRTPRRFFITTLPRKYISKTDAAPQLYFGSQGNKTYMSITNCTIKTTYVDASASCESRGTLGKADCGISSIRKSLAPTEPESSNVLDSLRARPASRGNGMLVNRFLSFFMDVLYDTDGFDGGSSSMVQWFLNDPLSAIEVDTGLNMTAELGDLDIKIVEKRLSLLYNTLWKTSWTFRSATGGSMFHSPNPNRTQSATSEITFPLPRVYALNIQWIAVYFISVGVMFGAAVASLVLHARCSAPPILGFVSSLVRDSVFFSHEGLRGNSTEQAAQTAKRLGGVTVMVADVQADGQVGRMAFAPVHQQYRIRKERWYE